MKDLRTRILLENKENDCQWYMNNMQVIQYSWLKVSVSSHNRTHSVLFTSYMRYIVLT